MRIVASGLCLLLRLLSFAFAMTTMTTQNLAGNSPPSSVRKRRTSKHGRRQWLDAYMLVAPALVMFFVFIIYPLLSTIYLSLYDYGLTDARLRFVGFGNYVELGSDPVFWRSLGNNLTILVVSVIVQVGLGLILAALIDRGARWGRSIFRTLNFAPVVMSAVAVGILWQLIYDPTVGLADRFVALFGIAPPSQGWLGDPHLAIFSILIVACWQYTGYVMVIVLAGMQSVSQELYEAAALDGAGESAQVYFRDSALDPQRYHCCCTHYDDWGRQGV